MLEGLQQGLAALEDVTPGGVELTGVPGVGDIAGTGREVHEHDDLAVGVATTDGAHVADVPGIHAYQQVVALVVGAGHLAGRLTCTADAVLSQFAAGWGIDAVAYLFGRRGCRGYLEMVGHSGLFYQMFHDEFGHRTAADVAVAHEEYSV